MVEHAIECKAEDFIRCPNFLRIVETTAAGAPTGGGERSR